MYNKCNEYYDYSSNFITIGEVGDQSETEKLANLLCSNLHDPDHQQLFKPAFRNPKDLLSESGIHSLLSVFTGDLSDG